jgi:hypothetical protein
MRTTIEMKVEHRAKLLELAARRGAKGSSNLLAEADSVGRRKRAVLLKGALRSKEAQAITRATEALRRTWR